jgi:hypothetical protein
MTALQRFLSLGLTGLFAGGCVLHAIAQEKPLDRDAVILDLGDCLIKKDPASERQLFDRVGQLRQQYAADTNSAWWLLRVQLILSASAPSLTNQTVPLLVDCYKLSDPQQPFDRHILQDRIAPIKFETELVFWQKLYESKLLRFQDVVLRGS